MQLIWYYLLSYLFAYVRYEILSSVYTYRVFAAAAKRSDFTLIDDKWCVALISKNRWQVQRFAASGSAARVQLKMRKYRIESYFGVFRSQFLLLIQSEGPISPTWTQS